MTTPDLADYVKSLAVSISCDSTPRDVAGRQTALPDPTVPQSRRLHLRLHLRLRLRLRRSWSSQRLRFQPL